MGLITKIIKSYKIEYILNLFGGPEKVPGVACELGADFKPRFWLGSHKILFYQGLPFYKLFSIVCESSHIAFPHTFSTQAIKKKITLEFLLLECNELHLTATHFSLSSRKIVCFISNMETFPQYPIFSSVIFPLSKKSLDTSFTSLSNLTIYGQSITL